MFRFFNIDQDEIADNGAGGGADPAAASQGGLDAAAAAAHTGAPKPQPEAAGAPAKPAAAPAQAAAADQVTLMVDGKPVQIPRSALEALELDQEVNGKKFKLPLKEVAARSQRFENITQKEQEVAARNKDLAAKIAKFDAMIAERQAAAAGEGEGAGGEQGEPDPKLTKLEAEVAELRQKQALQDEAAEQETWKKATEPVLQKFSGINETELRRRFLDNCAKAAEAGEDALKAENSPEGLQRAAESLISERETLVNERLEKLLADPENPKVKEIEQRAIEKFTAEKLKLSQAGGEHGGSSAGGAPKKIGSLADAEAAAMGNQR